MSKIRRGRRGRGRAGGVTSIDIIPTAGNPPGHTQVFDATIPNLNVVGTTSGLLM